MYKILIVEDEMTNAKILNYHVKSFFDEANIEDYQIDIAENGYEALGMNIDIKYDLVLLDVRMPKCDGIKYLTLLRDKKRFAHQPIVSMVTAMGEVDYINLFKRKGANAFLIKPYDKAKIFLILEHYIKIKKSIEEKVESNSEDSNDDMFDFDFDFEDDFVSQEDSENLDHANKTHQMVNVEEFLKDYDNLEYILEDIEDIDYILDELIHDLDQDIFIESLPKINDCLGKYAVFLNSLSSFGELSSSITLLKNNINETDFESLNEKNVYYFIEIVRAILEDLQSWKNFVFVEQTAQDVYYINASILSNIIQLQGILKKDF